LSSFNKKIVLTLITEPCGNLSALPDKRLCPFSALVAKSSILKYRSTSHLFAVSLHLEWKPKSVSPRCVNHEVSVMTPGVDGSQAEVAGLSKKLSQANVSQDEHVIIPEHIRVPDSERTHFIFGTFESESDLKPSVTASHTVVAKEDLNDCSPSR